ncbi:MAG: hypothetical protein IJY05_02935 [Clostridia bacterium]|nr:hypothetical protein [Clostridia bacterium]
MENFEKLQRLFDYLDRDIRYAHLTHKNDGIDKETLVRRRETLRKTAESITCIDLYILFYLKHVERISETSVWHALQEEYRAQCKRKNLLLNTEEFFDPLSVE